MNEWIPCEFKKSKAWYAVMNGRQSGLKHWTTLTMLQSSIDMFICVENWCGSSSSGTGLYYHSFFFFFLEIENKKSMGRRARDCNSISISFIVHKYHLNGFKSNNKLLFRVGNILRHSNVDSEDERKQYADIIYKKSSMRVIKVDSGCYGYWAKIKCILSNIWTENIFCMGRALEMIGRHLGQRRFLFVLPRHKMITQRESQK